MTGVQTCALPICTHKGGHYSFGEPGSEAEGEPLALRLVETVTWASETENLPGIFYPVYTLRDGVPIDQIAPPALDGVRSQIALYDYDANGHYIVSGCDITPFGRIGADQVFSIKEGTANILGFKRVREHALRFVVPEEPDLESIVAEPHTYDAATGAPTTVTVNRAPIAAVQQVIVVKRITETVIRGAIPGGQDPLTKSSVVEIESVNQGAVYYNASADFTLTGNSVSWAPGGVAVERVKNRRDDLPPWPKRTCMDGSSGRTVANGSLASCGSGATARWRASRFAYLEVTNRWTV